MSRDDARRLLTAVAVVALFFALRVPLLAAREPFFDELATVWVAEQPLARMFAWLPVNSESPFWVLAVRAWELLLGLDVTGARLMALACGTAALALCFRDPRAALALAAFPAHVFFSTEARPYALTALLVGIGAVTLFCWTQGGGVGWLAGGTLALLLAAYTHGYGALFLPLPFIASFSGAPASRRLARERPAPAAAGRRRASRRDGGVPHGFVASAVAGLLFLPGFRLAQVQPAGAIEWMQLHTFGERLLLVAQSLLQLGFAAEYEPIFLLTPPLLLRLASAAVVALVVVAGVRRSAEARFFAAFVAVPLAAVVVFALAGKTWYFPTRFESILAVPFALLLGSGLAALPRKQSLAALGALVALGTFVAWRSAGHHAARPLDPYRHIARFAATAPAGQPLVASRYAYLEVWYAVRPRPVIAFPSELAMHPGWSVDAGNGVLEAEAERLPPRFVWIGPGPAREAQVLRRRYALRAIAADGPVVAAVAEQR